MPPPHWMRLKSLNQFISCLAAPHEIYVRKNKTGGGVFFFFRTLSMIDERMKLNWFQMSSASSQRTYICVHICEMWQANFCIYVRVSVWQTINRTINFMNMMCISCGIPISSIQLIMSQNSLPSLQYPMTEMLQFLRGFSDLNGRTCYHEHENESDMQFFSHIHTAICHTMTVRSCFTDT